MADQSGRFTTVGFGKESSRGTTVAPTYWAKWLELDFYDRKEKIKNESAVGTMDAYNDSEIVKEWADGKITGKITDKTFGMILMGAFGQAPTSATHSGETVVYDHTFNQANNAVAQSLTIARKDGNTDKRFALSMLNKLDIEVVVGDYAKFTSEFTSQKSASASNTPALTTENEFVPRHAIAKVATNLAGLGAATAIPVKSFKMSIDNHVEPYFVFGSNSPQEINNQMREISGEIVLRYTDTTYETLWANNTDQALSITLTNTDTTIGTAANPAVAITLPKITLDEFEKKNDKDALVEQTIKFFAMYDFASGYSARAVLTNLVASY